MRSLRYNNHTLDNHTLGLIRALGSVCDPGGER